MAKVNKIVQYELANEVLDLKNKGLSQNDIASQIKLSHPDIKDLEDLSAMSINRFLKGQDIEKYEQQLVEGESPEDTLRTEFREKMYTLEEDTLEVYKIMRQALKNMVANGDDEKIIRSAKDILTSIEQSRRNWSTLVEQAYRQFGFVKEATKNVNIQYNTLLIDISKELCPECRKKVVNDILKFELENKES